MKRRNFLKLSATASVASLMPYEANALLKSVGNIDGCNFTNRKLILINLSGANDGLNTIIPINQYDAYSNLRPNIKVPNTGLNPYITLDSTLADNQQIGLNPALTGFKTLYDQGLMRIVQSVGYPSQNKSHFASKDLYMTGNDGNSLNNGTTSGWIGRFMEHYYSNLLLTNYPLAIQIGSLKNSLGFHGIVEHGMSINLTNQDPSGFYSVLNGLSGVAATNFPNTDFGTELQYITETDALSNTYSQTISNAFNSGTNAVSYPDTDIADQLKTVARLVSGDLDTKVYMVKLDGFDTHGNQVYPGESILGRHYTLLKELSDAIEVFYNDLNSQNISEDIVGLTYSEFGRKAKENGSHGTDHGEIAPMFVFGKPVEGGVSGTNPDLSEAVVGNNYQIQTVQHDYRSVASTLLQNFLGGDNTIIDTAFFNHTQNESFATTKINDLIKEEFKVPESCYTNTLSTNTSLDVNDWNIYPNPFKDIVTVKGKFKEALTLEVFSIEGKQVYNSKLTANTTNLSLGHLQSGVYIVKLTNTSTTVQTFKIVKA